MQGKTINGYTLQHQLGVGGMAEVWYAENIIGKKSAVKLLLPKFCHDEAIVARFQNEAKVMVQLEHPNIRQVLDFGSIDGRPCIVMEYLEGNDLKALMKSGRRFTDEELRRWWNQIADALNYTHAQGIVHRDIKPSNIFLDKKGNIKLLDFGIAKIKESISMTQTGATMGTLIYMSPEQVDDAKHLGPESDVYSLAVTFVHLLTGKAPYDTTNSSDYKIRKGIVEIPLDLSGVPADWQGFLAPYLEKDPKKRPALRHFEVASMPKEPEKLTEKIEHKQPQSQRIKEAEDEGTVVAEPKKPEPKPVEKQESIEKQRILEKGEKKKSKKGLWIGLGIIAVAATALFVLLKPDPDTEAFKACQTVNDYRGYIRVFGSVAMHYSEAKEYIEKFMEDSILEANRRLEQQIAQQKAEAEAKAKAENEKVEYEAYQICNTIATCDSYLIDYPNGRYVEEVKSKKDGIIASIPANSFSVASGRRVRFAKGNLQYQPSKKQWRIAPNPWDVVGEANSNIADSTNTYEGWIDLFGWGTGDVPTKYSIKNDRIEYEVFNDWGRNYGDGWRTLTHEEWYYLLHKRKTSSGIRYAKATVNGVCGLVVLPDNWSCLIHQLNYTNKEKSEFQGNIISSSTWNDVLSPAGAIFLPAAGKRFEASVDQVNITGDYWSSSESGPWGACLEYFHSLDVFYTSIARRYSGASVRLVKSIK